MKSFYSKSTQARNTQENLWKADLDGHERQLMKI